MHRAAVHVRFEPAVSTLAAVFGLVHGNVCVAQHVLSGDIGRFAPYETNAGINEDVVTGKQKGAC